MKSNKNVHVWSNFTNQKQWKEYLQNLIKTNQNALLLSIIRIYSLQTEEEKKTKQSIEENKVGFTKIDAIWFGGIVYKMQHKIPLSNRDIVVSRNKMVKYWRQLMNISKAKQMKQIEENQRLEKLHQKQVEENSLERLSCLENGIPCSYGICSECNQNF